MKTYAAIKAEIAKLEKQAEAARKAEIAGVVTRIKEAIAAYGLTAQDLGFRSGGAARSAGASVGVRAKAAGRGNVGVPKYRDPESGRTWTGRGKPPGWIVGAKDRTPFLIAEAATSSGGAGRRGAKAPRKARGTAGKPAGSGRAPAARKSSAARKSAPPEKTGAVVIESGVATE